jgi:hypothetical protein
MNPARSARRASNKPSDPRIAHSHARITRSKHRNTQLVVRIMRSDVRIAIDVLRNTPADHWIWSDDLHDRRPVLQNRLVVLRNTLLVHRVTTGLVWITRHDPRNIERVPRISNLVDVNSPTDLKIRLSDAKNKKVFRRTFRAIEKNGRRGLLNTLRDRMLASVVPFSIRSTIILWGSCLRFLIPLFAALPVVAKYSSPQQSVR